MANVLKTFVDVTHTAYHRCSQTEKKVFVFQNFNKQIKLFWVKNFWEKL